MFRRRDYALVKAGMPRRRPSPEGEASRTGGDAAGGDYRGAGARCRRRSHFAAAAGAEIPADARKAGVQRSLLVKGATPQSGSGLAEASDKLAADFGKWQTPWANHRMQRLTPDTAALTQRHEHTVGFHAGGWARWRRSAPALQRSTRIYGTSGNSFVAVVDSAAACARRRSWRGARRNKAAPHFNDQAARYAKATQGCVLYRSH